MSIGASVGMALLEVVGGMVLTCSVSRYTEVERPRFPKSLEMDMKLSVTGGRSEDGPSKDSTRSSAGA